MEKNDLHVRVAQNLKVSGITWNLVLLEPATKKRPPSPSVAVLVDVDDSCPSPREQEVATAGAQGNGETQVHVVGHEDEHEEVADDDLNDVQQRLERVAQRQQRTPATEQTSLKDKFHPIYMGIYIYNGIRTARS